VSAQLQESGSDEEAMDDFEKRAAHRVRFGKRSPHRVRFGKRSPLDESASSEQVLADDDVDDVFTMKRAAHQRGPTRFG